MTDEAVPASGKMKTPLWAGIIRWAGRIWAALLFIFWLMFVFGEAQGNLLKVWQSEPLLTTAMLMIVVGLLVGWWKELLGAILIIIGIVAFGIGDGKIPGWPFLLPGLSALAYLIAWLATHRPPAEPSTGNPA